MDATDVATLTTAVTDSLKLLIPLVAGVFAVGFGISSAIKYARKAGK